MDTANGQQAAPITGPVSPLSGQQTVPPILVDSPLSPATAADVLVNAQPATAPKPVKVELGNVVIGAAVGNNNNRIESAKADIPGECFLSISCYPKCCWLVVSVHYRLVFSCTGPYCNFAGIVGYDKSDTVVIYQRAGPPLLSKYFVKGNFAQAGTVESIPWLKESGFVGSTLVNGEIRCILTKLRVVGETRIGTLAGIKVPTDHAFVRFGKGSKLVMKIRDNALYSIRRFVWHCTPQCELVDILDTTDVSQLFSGFNFEL